MVWERLSGPRTTQIHFAPIALPVWATRASPHWLPPPPPQKQLRRRPLPTDTHLVLEVWDLPLSLLVLGLLQFEHAQVDETLAAQQQRLQLDVDVAGLFTLLTVGRRRHPQYIPEPAGRTRHIQHRASHTAYSKVTDRDGTVATGQAGPVATKFWLEGGGGGRINKSQKNHLPPKLGFSSDFGHLIWKMLEIYNSKACWENT